MRKIWIGLGLAIGYVLGARAGREKYEQLKRQAAKVAERPEVKQATERVAGATTGKLQDKFGENEHLRKAREYATNVTHRRQGATSEPISEPPLVTQPLVPPADRSVTPDRPITP
jgi:hypothetical protein